MTSAGKHKHKALQSRTMTFGFSDCVNPGKCDASAHGNVVDHEVCSCGMERSVNINQGHIEKGPWKQPPKIN